MTDEDQRKLSEGLIRLEGKLDAYAGSQNAVTSEHARRLDNHDRDISELRERVSAPPVESKASISGWTIAGVVIAAVVGMSTVLGILITLMRYIPDIP